jgi:hypothetical protein
MLSGLCEVRLPGGGTGKREGGGGLGAGTGAAGPAPKSASTYSPEPRPPPFFICGPKLVRCGAPASRMFSNATAAGGFSKSPSRQFGVGTVFYSCRSADRSPGIASVLRRLEARTGGANPSDPRRSRETPRPIFGRSLQPCAPLDHSPGPLEPLLPTNLAPAVPPVTARAASP